MNRFLRISILTVLTVCCVNTFAQDETEFNFSQRPIIKLLAPTSSGGPITTTKTATVGTVSLTVTPSRTGQQNQVIANSLRLYGGNITITDEAKMIVKIVFNLAVDKWNMTISKGNITNGSGSKIKIWQGREREIELKAISNTQIKSIVVTSTSTDGIDEVSSFNLQRKEEPMYNLAGQRVDKQYKGLVIQNGRKFLKQ